MSVITPERFMTGFIWSDYMKDIKKNVERFHENYEKFTFTERDDIFFSAYSHPVNVLVLAEDWCGDVVQSLPPIIRLLERSSAIHTRIFKRDDNLDIMDRYLTDGAKAIPYLVFMDNEFNELVQWGPRPTDCQAIMRNNKGKIPMDQIYPQIREWYKQHGNRPLTEEIREILERLE